MQPQVKTGNGAPASKAIPQRVAETSASSPECGKWESRKAKLTHQVMSSIPEIAEEAVSFAEEILPTLSGLDVDKKVVRKLEQN